MRADTLVKLKKGLLDLEREVDINFIVLSSLFDVNMHLNIVKKYMQILLFISILTLCFPIFSIGEKAIKLLGILHFFFSVLLNRYKDIIVFNYAFSEHIMKLYASTYAY